MFFFPLAKWDGPPGRCFSLKNGGSLKWYLKIGGCWLVVADGMPKMLLREIFGIIFFGAAMVNMRTFVRMCWWTFSDTIFSWEHEVLSHTHRHADLGGYLATTYVPHLHHRLSPWGNLLDPFLKWSWPLATLQPGNPEKELITYPQELNGGLHQAEYSNLPMWSALANGRSSRCCKILDINFQKGHPTSSGAQILKDKIMFAEVSSLLPKGRPQKPPLIRNIDLQEGIFPSLRNLIVIHLVREWQSLNRPEALPNINTYKHATHTHTNKQHHPEG